ncbi:MAG: hypothetical protein HOG80_10870, partial [Candidatus Marinimicrobia bacterium]|nr:hypothetical protein [Candidatus Neomarinimicrobiota bacterium]
MKSKPLFISTLFLFVTLQGVTGAALGDNDGYFNRLFGGANPPGVAPVKNPQYLEECGSCHFPYQPGLLPARSWTKLMADLENHFGENAEVATDDLNSLSSYLEKNAADHANYKRSKKVMRSLNPSDTPLRATKTPYLISKHDELSRKMVTDNSKVGSI